MTDNYKKSRLEEECQRQFTESLIIPNNKPLYHYTKLKSAQNILETKKFRMSHYRNTNDHNELLYGMKLVISVLRDCIRNNELTAGLYSNFHKFLNKEVTYPGMHLYIGCFCSRSNNQHLLDNYSCSRRKYLESIFSILDITNQPLLVEVIYDEFLFLQKVEKIFNGYQDYIIKNDSFWSTFDFKQLFLNDLFISILKDVFILSGMFKRSKWAPEEEIRLMNFNSVRHRYIELSLINSDLKISP